MFITVSTYRAKVGEEDAIVALHEDWQRTQQSRTRSYLSGELLKSVNDGREFITILHFESGESAQALANDPERKAWYQRLVSLTERMTEPTEYTREWSQT